MVYYLPGIFDLGLTSFTRWLILLLISLPSSYVEGQILDTLFGDHGTVMTLVGDGSGMGDEAYSVVIQPDGKIIAIGTSVGYSTPYTFALARFKTNGTIDSTFGMSGAVKTRFAANTIDRAYGAALKTDGKIILVGSSMVTFLGFGVARYKTDGFLDTSFGSTGTVRTYLNGENGSEDQANCVAVQTDGKIVVAGSTHNAFTDGQFGVVRYDTSGNLDITFGTNGTASFFINGGSNMIDACYSIALQPDGKIVIAGACYAYTDTTRFAFGLARLQTDGTLDTTFGGKGSVMTHISDGGLYTSTSGDEAMSVALQPDGKIVTAGYSMDRYGHYAFAVVRYNTNGSLDTTFGFDKKGIVRTHIYGGNSTGDFGNAVLIQPNGKIVVAGSSSDALNQVSFAVARYLPDGILDYQFGAHASGTGRVFINGGVSADEARSVALQADGKIVLAGESKDIWTSHEFSLARILPQENPISVKNEPSLLPGKFELEQNFPNPFNPTTTIRFGLLTRSRVRLQIFNILGQMVTELVNNEQAAGYQSVIWNAPVASGMYFYRIEATDVSNPNNRFVDTKKMILLK